MTVSSIDTQKLAERLHGSGLSRKQASGIAEAVTDLLIDVLADRPSRDAVIEAVETLGRAVDQRFLAVDQRFDRMDQRFDQREAKVDEQFAEQKAANADIRALLVKILDGQAILHQNDMEMKRRLDRLGA